MFQSRSVTGASDADAPPDTESVGFILRLGRALHTYGYPAHRLEEALGEASRLLKLEGQFFTTPTSIFASFGPQDDQRTFLIRVEPGGTDLGKLRELDEVVDGVLAGKLSPADGAARINRIVTAPPRYGRVLRVIAFGLVSGAASRFLGGGGREVAVAALIGLFTGLLSLAAEKWRSLGRVFEPVAAFAAAVLAAALGSQFGTHSVSNDVLAGLIVLLPGLMLTGAMIEISTGHWVSGTARLSGALLTLLTIGFGVALGGRLAGAFFGAPVVTRPVALPLWTEFAALVVAPLAFTVLLRAHPKDAFWIVGAGALGVVGSRVGVEWLGPELSVFVGALTVGVASNVYARLRERPSMITLVPGILLLVPGSLGFRSVASLTDEKVVSGVETAFKMVLIAVALAAGILISRLILPPRRIV
jgi:uncharacterized membrane protein YjjP (DUF1212 family)